MNEASFLQAIGDDPRDDAARLIYADWLEERGDARAEYIRNQCELTATPFLESRREGLLARWLAPHASSPHRVVRDMTDAGYRLIATHDIVRGYWYGEFRVAE